MALPRPCVSAAVLHEDALDYTPVPSSVGLARSRAARLVSGWGHPGIAGDAALVVGELAANAVLHGSVRGRLFRVRLTLTASAVRIEVSDARGERRPEVGSPSGDEKSGRGMVIVDALAARWGVLPRTVGKTVWAELDLR
ncbi:ATP-binding protein [Streptomyces sp. TRM 70361]|uniref:ATP-binding protein n=1 Tax=Streptomyces sp. TRM 70361 TaxID=3116553 RepID=UPI002E7B2D2C|nr:ATP-binding protein [Streptomyces sp. TRM 70361]MEE1940619.1 ATP-binding protein [Streptomyces sp. TRM 70361]